MYSLISFSPFFSFLVSSLFGRFLGRKGTPSFTTFCIFLTARLSTLVFHEVASSRSFRYIRLITWTDCALLHASWGSLSDSSTVLMLIVVSYVPTLVHSYPIGHMSLDPHLQRFLSYLSLSTFFMLISVTADNFIQMFIGWEGVGPAPSLLINSWSTRIQANKSAMKALIVNRIGDPGLCIAIFMILNVFGSVDYSTVLASLHLFLGSTFYFFFFPFDFLTLIRFFLFIAAIGKSAQPGLHTWPPDAMEGPTPVSASIHAATTV